MATIVSAATGNFGSGTTWVGGVVPGAGDVAQVAAGHVVTIAANATCTAVECINNTGYFLLNDGVTLTADVRGGSTAAQNYVLQYNGSGSATIIGDVYLSSAVNSSVIIRHNGSGTLTINGSLYNTVTQSFLTIVAVSGNNAKLTVTGNATGPVNSGASSCIYVTAASATITVNGNVTGASNGYGIQVTNACTTLYMSIYGTVSPGTGITSYGIYIDTATATNGIVSLFGAVNGSTTTTASGVYVTGTGSLGLEFSGSVNANSGPGVTSTCACAFLVSLAGGYGNYAAVLNGTTAFNTSNGAHSIVSPGNYTISASTQYPAVYVGINAQFYLGPAKLVDAANGRPAISADGLLRLGSPSTFTHSVRSGNFTYTTGVLNNGTAVTLVDSNVTDVPAPANVRSGVVYQNSTKTGTLIVPPTSAVSVGVPVDNTVGTALNNATDVATLVGAQIAAATSTP